MDDLLLRFSILFLLTAGLDAGFDPESTSMAIKLLDTAGLGIIMIQNSPSSFSVGAQS